MYKTMMYYFQEILKDEELKVEKSEERCMFMIMTKLLTTYADNYIPIFF